ncbi:MAG: aminotransferase class V-fold PLP-dependent enzyme [Ignavibacteriales bacterium]|nr:aminotransferase class V-fold PLP-dependent enzyme [Ignavibacteriales bacterium]
MKHSNDKLLRYRKEFPILKNCTYLISNSLGAMPKSVYEKMNEYAQTWATRGVRAWNDSWWDLSITVGNSIAPLIGAKENEIAMLQNTTLMQAILISCFDFKGKRYKIVFTDMEFPSTMYVHQQFATSLGAKIQVVKSKDGISVSTQKLLDAIDEKTLLVPVSHVLFKSAYIQDVKAITEKAKRVGAIVILDAYHSAGTIPVDVKKLDVDIVVGGVLKWLCGGPGGAFLWMRPSLRKKLQPKITGWFAHQEPFALETTMRYTDSPFRFLNSTPSIPALYASVEGVKIISSIGMKQIREKSIRQTSLIIEKAKEFGFHINSPLKTNDRAGTVTLNVPFAYEVSRELLKRNIIVDFREGVGIRIAPHFYNSDEEVLFAVEQIKEIVGTRTFSKKDSKRTKVT